MNFVAPEHDVEFEDFAHVLGLGKTLDPNSTR